MLAHHRYVAGKVRRAGLENLDSVLDHLALVRLEICEGLLAHALFAPELGIHSALEVAAEAGDARYVHDFVRIEVETREDRPIVAAIRGIVFLDPLR